MVKYIVMRARPLHLDVRFKDNSPRFRLMTSNIQAVTNELCIRCSMRENKPSVLFEPNARPFDFNSYYLTLEVMVGKDGSGNRFVARKAVGTADLLSEQVDDETKKKVRQAEANMEKVYDLSCDLEKIGTTMESTIAAQTDQIGRIAEKTQSANQRVASQNQQVKKINRDLS